VHGSTRGGNFGTLGEITEPGESEPKRKITYKRITASFRPGYQPAHYVETEVGMCSGSAAFRERILEKQKALIPNIHWRPAESVSFLQSENCRLSQSLFDSRKEHHV